MSDDVKNSWCHGTARLGALVVVISGFGGCDGCGSGPELVPHSSPRGALVSSPISVGAALRTAGSCDDALAVLRANEHARMQQVLESNLEFALGMLNDPESNCYDPNPTRDCGGPWGVWGDDGGCLDAVAADAGGGNDFSDPVSPRDAGAESYSTTNNQVRNVDEADLVKNTGAHIYIGAGDSVTVIDAWPPEETHIIGAKTDLGRPAKLLLAGDRLAVFSEIGDGPNCEYDDYYGDVVRGNAMQLSILDVADPAHPRLERTLSFGAQLVQARLIDGTMHAVLRFPDSTQLPLLAWPESLPTNLCQSSLSADEVRAQFAATTHGNTTLIDSATLTSFLPGLRVRDVDYHDGDVVREDESLLLSCEAFFTSDAEMSRDALSVISIALVDDSSIGTATVFGGAAVVYASASHLYVAGANQASRSTDRTVIRKFALVGDGSPAQYVGRGTVPGYLVNQFAMDEHEGSLRVATTEESWPPTNHLFVLGEDADGPMSVLGAVEDYGVTEDIRSVRFDGDRGFVVTFRKTDPLFAFDLSDPTAPKILGELKIPGFSTYMHLMDEGHLLTIGFDTDDQGDFAWFQGVSLQIFDVTDMASPALLHKEVIGSRGSNSDATADHLAFTFFGDHLAIPIQRCDGSWDGSDFGDMESFDGLMVYRVSVEDGFTYVGGVDHRTLGDPGEPRGSCGAWWADPNSGVKRSLFLEHYVYSLSSGRLKVNHLDALDEDVADLELPPMNWAPRDGYDCYSQWEMGD